MTLFRFTTLLSLLLLLVPKQNAIAQTSIYGSVALVNYDFENNNTSAAKSDTAGFVGGVFYNFPIQSRLTAGVDGRQLPTLALLLRNVKLFCKVCDSAEAYSLLWFCDATAETLNTRTANPLLELPLRNWFQVFVLLYQCQICKSDPVSFIVRRENWHLILEGRSPIEEVEVPKEIPKIEAHLYKDSVIAMQTGKYLAAILYLRVFIEQFGRRQTGISGRENGEVILDAYAKQIPEGQRGQMPSLKAQYDRLSEAIHLANEDKELYEECRTAVNEHFELRRLFKLSEIVSAKKNALDKQ